MGADGPHHSGAEAMAPAWAQGCASAVILNMSFVEGFEESGLPRPSWATPHDQLVVYEQRGVKYALSPNMKTMLEHEYGGHTFPSIPSSLLSVLRVITHYA